MNTDTVSDSGMKGRVEDALQTIRPYLEADGGDVRLLEVDSDMVVHLELLGACGTCPMSSMTLKAGVEEAIKRAVPEITAVKAMNVEPNNAAGL
ncbi:MAG TPA: hypothetical protein DCR93_36210 [Cytophagales bacterium]|nr:hypothetical protein [Cytophagales bacterium]HAP64702.1 hypothetical protein [Cytophagales bacterium]